MQAAARGWVPLSHRAEVLMPRHRQADEARRRQIVWQIERKLAEDAVRPILFCAYGANCWHPYVNGATLLRNRTFSTYRYEGVWLDK